MRRISLRSFCVIWLLVTVGYLALMLSLALTHCFRAERAALDVSRRVAEPSSDLAAGLIDDRHETLRKCLETVALLSSFGLGAVAIASLWIAALIRNPEPGPILLGTVRASVATVVVLAILLVPLVALICLSMNQGLDRPKVYFAESGIPVLAFAGCGGAILGGAVGGIRAWLQVVKGRPRRGQVAQSKDN